MTDDESFDGVLGPARFQDILQIDQTHGAQNCFCKIGERTANRTAPVELPGMPAMNPGYGVGMGCIAEIVRASDEGFALSSDTYGRGGICTRRSGQGINHPEPLGRILICRISAVGGRS